MPRGRMPSDPERRLRCGVGLRREHASRLCSEPSCANMPGLIRRYANNADGLTSLTRNEAAGHWADSVDGQPSPLRRKKLGLLHTNREHATFAGVNPLPALGNPRAEDHDVSVIVLHALLHGGTPDGMVDWVLNPGRHRTYSAFHGESMSGETRSAIVRNPWLCQGLRFVGTAHYCRSRSLV